jgi:hypothetical protein
MSKRKSGKRPFKRPNRLARMARWQFALIFLIPLLLAEYLFYRGGRPISMAIFPFLWVGFWAALFYANNWEPLREWLQRDA